VARPFARRLKKAVFSAIPSSRLIERGPRSSRRVALTFDDGPDERTLEYLDVMDKLGARGTFFLVGKYCEAHPELVREYIRRGHQVAAHGYDHSRFTTLGTQELADQLARTDVALGPQATRRRWVRPPYGAMNARVLGQLLLDDTRIALWSLDSHDYEVKATEELVRRCSPPFVRGGDVILLHEGQQWTLDALPGIIEALRGAGYSMVTMADLVGA
jgi:peptidoglycan/xylan/chitin deacetylase (PgdA/CDA1 family)